MGERVFVFSFCREPMYPRCSYDLFRVLFYVLCSLYLFWPGIRNIYGMCLMSIEVLVFGVKTMFQQFFRMKTMELVKLTQPVVQTCTYFRPVPRRSVIRSSFVCVGGRFRRRNNSTKFVFVFFPFFFLCRTTRRETWARRRTCSRPSLTLILSPR